MREMDGKLVQQRKIYLFLSNIYLSFYVILYFLYGWQECYVLSVLYVVVVPSSWKIIKTRFPFFSSPTLWYREFPFFIQDSNKDKKKSPVGLKKSLLSKKEKNEILSKLLRLLYEKKEQI